MDLNPILHFSAAKEMKCSFLYYVQLLMISQACQWTWTASTTCLQPKNEMLIFQLCSTSDDWPGWSMDSNPIHHPSPAKKMKSSFFITFTFWCWPDWSMDLKPICHPSPAKKNEMLVFRLRSFLMICLADWWIWSPSATPLQPKRWNAQFLIMFNFWWSARLVDGLKPHLPPLSSQENEMHIFVLHSTSDVGQAGRWTETPSTTPLHPKKWNAHFLITFNFWWLAGLVNGLEPHPPPLFSQKSEMLIFVLHSTSDVGQTGQWTWTSFTTPLQPKIRNAHFWVTFNFWWLVRLFDELKPHLPALSSQ